MIDMKPVTKAVAMKCPCCSTTLMNIHSHRTEMVHGGFLFDDGDSIGGLWEKLTDEQKTTQKFDYQMLVGNCPNCGKSYYGVIASFMAGKDEYKGPWFGYDDTTIKQIYICTTDNEKNGVPESWYCEEHETPDGLFHMHWFGLFQLKSKKGVVGPAGVTACGPNSNSAWKHSADVLVALWDDLRKPFMNKSKVDA